MKKTQHWIILLLIFLMSPQFSAKCQVVSQFRGQNRDGIYKDDGLLKEWPEAGPELLWSLDSLGKGYSSPAVTPDAVYINGKKDSSEYLSAIDLSGKLLWEVKSGAAWKGTFPESRCTPTVDKENIYLVTSFGEVKCFRRKDGKELWSVPVYEQFEGAYGHWGIAESLLLVGEKVIFTPGGKQTTMVALNKINGDIIWQSESINDTVGYASPIVIEKNNKQILLTALKNNAIAVDAGTGKLLCSFPFSKDKKPMGVNTPLYNNGKVFFTSGYDAYSYMLELQDDLSKFSLVWKDTVFDSEYGYVVLKDGIMYGSTFINQRKGNWCSANWETGKLNYETPWQTKGPVILAGEMLYCLDEKSGNMALVKAAPEKFEVISSFKLPKGRGPCWAGPVIYNGILYVRRGGALMSFQIKG